MAHREPDRRPGLTVYGCDRGEAQLFQELAPRFGVVATTTGDPVSHPGTISLPENRFVSVSHSSALTRRELRALQDAGVVCVSTRSIGYDHIDLAAAAELGITVENVLYAPDGVADFTVLLILLAIRNAAAALTSAARHDFRLSGARDGDLRDMTVGVLGAGRIGSAVIRRLEGFGCRVLACDQRPTADVAAEFVPLDELLRESDVLTVHVPLDADTHHLIGREQIDSMRPGAFLVNTARGALVDTEAVIAALEGGKLGGVALDVLEGEEGVFYVDRTADPVVHPHLLRLQQLPNAVVTPHLAFHTRRTLAETVEATLTSCLDFERRNADGADQDRDLVRGVLGGT